MAPVAAPIQSTPLFNGLHMHPGVDFREEGKAENSGLTWSLVVKGNALTAYAIRASYATHVLLLPLLYPGVLQQDTEVTQCRIIRTHRYDTIGYSVGGRPDTGVRIGHTETKIRSTTQGWVVGQRDTKGGSRT